MFSLGSNPGYRTSPTLFLSVHDFFAPVGGAACCLGFRLASFQYNQSGCRSFYFRIGCNDSSLPIVGGTAAGGVLLETSETAG